MKKIIIFILLSAVCSLAQVPGDIRFSYVESGTGSNAEYKNINLSGPGALNLNPGQAPGIISVVEDDVQPAYLMATFQAGIEQLSILGSSNGKNFSRLSASTVYTAPSGSVRDPSILFHNGRYYVAHTRNGFSTGLNFGIAVSDNLRDWEQLAVISPSGLGSKTLLWSPEWFVDDDGSIYIFFASGTPYQLYVIKAASDDLTTWNSATQITGTGLPSAMIDPFIIKTGTTYNIFYKNESTLRIAYMNSNSLSSGYTVANSGITIFGTNVEGPCVVQIDNDTWRAFYTSYSGDQGVYYSDSTDNFATWSIPNRAAFGTASGSSNTDAFYHGTVVKAKNTKMLLDMLALNTPESLARPGSISVPGNIEAGDNLLGDRLIFPNFVNSGTFTNSAIQYYVDSGNYVGIDLRSGALNHYNSGATVFYAGSTQSSIGTLKLSVSTSSVSFSGTLLGTTSGTTTPVISGVERYANTNTVGSSTAPLTNKHLFYTDANNDIGIGVHSGGVRYTGGISGMIEFWTECTPLSIGSRVGYFNTNGFNIETGKVLIFEGSTADVNETTVTVVNPTQDNTVTIPNESGGIYVWTGSRVSNGSTGDQTLNVRSGSVNLAAASTSLVVTSTFSSTNSVIQGVVMTNDSTTKSVQIVPGNGSFTIFPNVAPTAETRIGFTIY